MTVFFEIRQAGDIVVARVSGEWPPLDQEILAVALEHWSSITNACLERGITRVLSVSEATGVSSSSAALRIYSNPAAFGWDRSIRMAIVRSDARARQIIGMAVQVAKRDGWPFELFADEADGLRWLMSGNAARGP